MIYREIVSEARRLPLHERLLLVEELLRDIRQSEKRTSRERRRRVPPFSSLRGALKQPGEQPSDTELKDLYVDHLIEKYL